MKRTDSPGHLNKQFVDRDLTMKKKGTRLEAYWLNQVQEEICAVIEGHGFTLDGKNWHQLKDVFDHIRSVSDDKYIHGNASGGGQVINGNMNINGDARISGSLIVDGDSTIIHAEEIKLDDNIITLNANAVGTPVESAGLEVERGSRPNAVLQWNESQDYWTLTKEDGSASRIMSYGDPEGVRQFVRPMFPSLKYDHGTSGSVRYRMIGQIKKTNFFDSISIKGIIGDKGYGETCKVNLQVSYSALESKIFLTGSAFGNSAGNSIMVKKSGDWFNIYLVTAQNGIARLRMETNINEFLHGSTNPQESTIQVYTDKSSGTAAPSGTTAFDLAQYTNVDGSASNFVGFNTGEKSIPLSTSNYDLLFGKDFVWGGDHKFVDGVDITKPTNFNVMAKYGKSYSTSITSAMSGYPSSLTSRPMGVFYSHNIADKSSDFAISVDDHGKLLWKTAANSTWKSFDNEVSKAIDQIKNGTNVGIDITNVSTAQGHNSINFKLNTEYLQDLIGAMVTGNTENGVTVTYNDTTGKLDFTTNGDIPETDKNNIWTATNTFQRIRSSNSSEVSLTSTAHAFQIGADNAVNIAMDGNEIQARNNKHNSTLYLNPHGGVTQIGAAVVIKGTMTCQDTIIETSDRRVKDNLEVITDALAKVNTLNGYTYTRIDKDTDQRFTGVIAQEVEAVLPEAVRSDAKGQLAVSYGNMNGLLIEAINELTAKVEKLEAEANKSLWSKFMSLFK